MGATDGRAIKTTTRIRNKSAQLPLNMLPHHTQPPHPASLKSWKRRSLRRLAKAGLVLLVMVVGCEISPGLTEYEAKRQSAALTGTGMNCYASGSGGCADSRYDDWTCVGDGVRTPVVHCVGEVCKTFFTTEEVEQ